MNPTVNSTVNTTIRATGLVPLVKGGGVSHITGYCSTVASMVKSVELKTFHIHLASDAQGRAALGFRVWLKG